MVWAGGTKKWGEVHTNDLYVAGERVKAFTGERLEIVVDKSGGGDFDNLDQFTVAPGQE